MWTCAWEHLLASSLFMNKLLPDLMHVYTHLECPGSVKCSARDFCVFLQQMSNRCSFILTHRNCPVCPMSSFITAVLFSSHFFKVSKSILVFIHFVSLKLYAFSVKYQWYIFLLEFSA